MDKNWAGKILNYRFQIQKNILYVTVQQETVRQVQIMTFNHLLHLKYEWHVKRKTGEVLRANDRGANSGQGQPGSVKSMAHRLWPIDYGKYNGSFRLNKGLKVARRKILDS